MDIVRKAISTAIGDAARRHAEADALIHTDAGVQYNYSLFWWEVGRAAKGMIRLGIERGDRVAIWAVNIPEWIVAQMALVRIGAVYVPVDPLADQEDVGFILSQSEAKAVIMTRGVEEEEHLNAILSMANRLPLLENVVLISTESHPDVVSWSEMLAQGEDVDSRDLQGREMEIDPEDPVAIMYTSGTTGNPKGVVLDHLGLLNKSLFSAERQGIGAKDRMCLFFPLFHMFGNTCIALCGLLSGAALVMPCTTYDPEKILRTIAKEKCTAVYGSPGMISGLLEHPLFTKKRWQSVSKGIVGGAAPSPDFMKKLIRDVGVSDVTVGYGITETSSWITMTSPRDSLEKRVSTMGTPLACNQVKIVDHATGEDLPNNRQGELCVRGLLMKSYHRMPEATAKVLDGEGWFHTGDLGEMDDNGYVRITGRIKDLIQKDGIEIRPAEVEEAILTMPDVVEVQVFGFTHPRTGREMAAWIKLKPGSRMREEEVTRFLEKRVAPDRIPGYVKFVSEYPMTRTGKVQKRKLKEMAEKEYGG
ncbi:MAG: AMP-binding protein [Desulfobacteraceae bacterium]|nr:MAG: AMP-binding protein [Desulfobacteraceae bacterium]